MSGTIAYNGQIPTDPHAALVLLLGIVWAAGQLTTEQAQALTAVGSLSELALLAFDALRARRQGRPGERGGGSGPLSNDHIAPKGRTMRTDYPYLPAECRKGDCDHEPDRCVRYRSRRCESGECTHARQNLLCAVNYPTTASHGEAVR